MPLLLGGFVNSPPPRSYHELIKRVEKLLDFISLFVDHFEWMDYHEWDSSGVKSCGLEHCSCASSLEHEDAFLLDEPLKNEVFDHVIKRFAQILDPGPNSSERARNFFWLTCIDTDIPLSTVIWATNHYRNFVDTKALADGYSPILESIARNRWNLVEAFAKSGADLHHVGTNKDCSPIEECATSLALYNSRNFCKWRDILRGLKTDLDKFIVVELQNGRLQKDEWNAKSLQTLFKLKISPANRQEDCKDCECGSKDFVDMGDTDDGYEDYSDEDREIEEDDEDDGRCGGITEVMVEIRWQKLLERIKHGKDLEGYIDRYLEDSDSESQDSCDCGRDIVEILDVEDSEGESQRKNMADEEESREEESREEEDKGYEEDEGQDEYESPEWFCITCWHDRTYSDISSAPTSEVDSDEEDSPMLLRVNL